MPGACEEEQILCVTLQPSCHVTSVRGAALTLPVPHSPPPYRLDFPLCCPCVYWTGSHRTQNGRSRAGQLLLTTQHLAPGTSVECVHLMLQGSSGASATWP